jgi:phenylpropionate dioxygenase-like ring-hydroxylating dioxygenase large terminal subunit
MRQEENDKLTLTGPGTAMGEMLRQYWVPALHGSALERDGPPLRVKLFSQNFVVFRATDGRVGFLDEACPHRGVSLALGRNEENGLRCIFHGWKRDVTGAVVDAPCEPRERREAFCKNIRVNRYAVHEAAGVIWVYLGRGEVPAFPDFEFSNLPPDQVTMRRALVPYNWLQGVEAHIDSSHVPFLHRGFLVQEKAGLDPAIRDALGKMMEDTVPRFETDEKAYGLREGALRDLGNGQTYARIREIVLPFYTFIPGAFQGACHGRMSVPIDDNSSAEWYVLFDPLKPLAADEINSIFMNTSDDPDNFAANLGNPEELWGQDRRAMRDGHYSGLTRNIPFEDFIVQSSMGPRLDRTMEQLGSADIILIKVRRMLLEGVRKFERGEGVSWRGDFDYGGIRARSICYDASRTSWREFTWEAQAADRIVA